MFAYLEYTIAFFVIVWIFETYIDVRQHRKYQERQIPQTLRGIVSEEKFLKAQSYGLDKSQFGMISDIFSLLSSIVMLKYHWMPWLWGLSGRWMVWISGSSMSSEVGCFLFF
jgi:STE24 endopeptidase